MTPLPGNPRVVGLAGSHATIGSRARVGAQSGVVPTLEPGALAVGRPARPPKKVFREIATPKRLAKRA